MAKATTGGVMFWLCLAAAPAVLLAIELFHPAGFTDHDPTQPGMFAYLSMAEPHTPEHKALYYWGPNWWFALHMTQTPLVVLVAIGLYRLGRAIGRDDGPWAWAAIIVGRAALFVFAVYYTALDSIGGIGLARQILIAKTFADAPTDRPHLTPEQLEGVRLVLNQFWIDPWVGGVGSVISQTGSWAIFAAPVLSAIALFLSKRAAWPGLVVLIAFGWELQLTHAALHGPIAFALLIAAALLLRFWRPAAG